jgi:galactose mutarotase-like enzyme
MEPDMPGSPLPFDRDLSDPSRLWALAGNMRQLCRAELLEVPEGPGRGARVGRLSAARGFDVEVFVDRGLDLGGVSWRGVPLAWLSAAGPVAPSLSRDESDWQRSFQGGLLTTCGLDQFGRESVDEGESLPMHGRVHAVPAERVRTWSERVNGSWEVGIGGQVRQASAFRENLRLERAIITSLGSDRLRVRDRVTNDGPQAWPHMVLYHLNFGWPLVAPGSKLAITSGPGTSSAPPHAVIPRDEVAAAGAGEWMKFEAPAQGFAEQVFKHDLPPDGHTTVRLTSPVARLTAEVQFSTAQLPHLFQWKMLGEGTYVLGIEPANSSGIGGRADARADGSLQILEPGESRDYEISISVTAALE